VATDAHLIDCHVLTLPSTFEPWRRLLAADLACQPCNVHWVDGVPGHIGAARWRGLTAGSAPYVAFADPDDRVLPGALDACLGALIADQSAVVACTAEQRIDMGGNRVGMPDLAPFSHRALVRSPQHLHHIIVARRAPALIAADRVRHLRRGFNWAWTMVLAQMGGAIRLPIVGYEWRVHAGGFHRTPGADPDEIRRAAQVI